MKVLWLASWYPNQVSPYEGDFIQRHARAVTAYSKVTVVYLSQAGETLNVYKTQFIDQEKDNVIEKIIFFKFKKTGVKFRFYRKAGGRHSCYATGTPNWIGNYKVTSGLQ